MLVDAMAEQWYGYGRWDAPFWFLGPEPGGGDPDNAAAAWDKLGRGEVVDCKDHHFAFEYKRWHTAPYPLQRTWRRLMLLLLSFKNEDTSPESLKAYQAGLWGAGIGETCAIELSSVASPKLSFRGKHDRNAHRSRRIAHIRRRLVEYHPTFLVMYSDDKTTYRPVWEEIAGGVFDPEGMRRTSNTIAMVTPHPVAFGHTDSDWLGFGASLRKRCEDEGLDFDRTS